MVQYHPPGGNYLNVEGADSLGATVSLTVPVDTLITTIFFDLASAISAGVASGITRPFHDATGSTIPPVTSGVGALNTGAIDGTAATVAGPARVTLPGGYGVFVDNASNAETVVGLGDTNPPVSILGGTGGLRYISGTGYDGGIGFGTVAAGGSAVGNLVQLSASTVSTGGFLISLGAGDIPGLGAGINTVLAASGTNTILGAPGGVSGPSQITPTYGVDRLLIDLTAGSAVGDVSSTDFIELTGNDTVTAASGNSHVTVSVDGGATALVDFGSSWTGTLLLTDLATSDASALGFQVHGGGGAVTVFGGLASTVVQGGAAGRNIIVAGTVYGTITGGGTGDKLYASSIGGGVIKAGAGLESLIGAGHHSQGGNPNQIVPGFSPAGSVVGGTLFIGSTVVGSESFFYAGTGADTIRFGAGIEGADGNAGIGGSVYDFNTTATSLGGGASIAIFDFTVGKDSMVFTGYGETEAQIAATATIANGNTTFHLQDNTTVTVNNVTTLFTDPTAKFLTPGSTPFVNAVDSGGVASSLTGASGQTLLASSLGGGVLSAGGGNETLIGASHNPQNSGVTNPYQVGSTIAGTVYNASNVAGSNTSIYVGPGADTVNFGAGTQFADGNVGIGGTLYNISSALTSVGGAAHIEIRDFTVGTDTLVASGYGENAAFVQQTSATIAGGNTTFTLSDGTTVQIDNVTTLFNDPNSKLVIS